MFIISTYLPLVYEISGKNIVDSIKNSNLSPGQRIHLFYHGQTCLKCGICRRNLFGQISPLLEISHPVNEFAYPLDHVVIDFRLDFIRLGTYGFIRRESLFIRSYEMPMINNLVHLKGYIIDDNDFDAILDLVLNSCRRIYNKQDVTHNCFST